MGCFFITKLLQPYNLRLPHLQFLFVHKQSALRPMGLSLCHIIERCHEINNFIRIQVQCTVGAPALLLEVI